MQLKQKTIESGSENEGEQKRKKKKNQKHQASQKQADIINLEDDSIPESDLAKLKKVSPQPLLIPSNPNCEKILLLSSFNLKKDSSKTVEN